MEYNLLPCPFCGGEAEFITTGNLSNHAEVSFLFTIGCKSCKTKLTRDYRVDVILGKKGQIITAGVDEREVAIEKWSGDNAM